MTAEMRRLIALTYAFIRQLIELLPSFISYTEDLREQRFKKLDGSVDSYDEAITVLGALFELSPPILLCVIDALEVLNERSTTKHIPALMIIEYTGILQLKVQIGF